MHKSKSTSNLHNDFHLSNKSLCDTTHINYFSQQPHQGALGTWIFADEESNKVKWLDQGHPTTGSRTGCRHPSAWPQLLLLKGPACLLRACGHPTHQFQTVLRNRTVPRKLLCFNAKGTLSIFIFFVLHLKVEIYFCSHVYNSALVSVT